jgi:hypothetical protein
VTEFEQMLGVDGRVAIQAASGVEFPVNASEAGTVTLI